jgi:hypothetical protein
LRLQVAGNLLTYPALGYSFLYRFTEDRHDGSRFFHSFAQANGQIL